MSQPPRPLPFVLGIVGDSGSGKSTIANGVRALLGPERVTPLELDDYHRYTRAERAERGLTALNPQVHNLELMQEHLQLLRRGRPIRNRLYDHSDGSFGPVRVVEPREVVVARGLLGFPSAELCDCYDLAVFLQPEPELLFRWKLRRDVQTRGYTEAQVLKYIAQHLLDSKAFVLPQGERADLVVRSEIPEWDAPDALVRTSLVLRRSAAEALRDEPILARFGDHVQVTEGEGAGELILHLADTVCAEEVDGWARESFPDSYREDGIGGFMDEAGAPGRRASLAFTQLVIAHLTQKLRRVEEAAVEAGVGG